MEQVKQPTRESNSQISNTRNPGIGINGTFRVIGNHALTPNCCFLRVERNDVRFRAGQCFNLGRVDTGVNREYSIYSGENDTYLEFIIKEVADGTVSPQLQALKKGDSVEIAGPYGLFTLVNRDPLNERFCFIGTGTGIAPFRSFVRTWPNMDYKLIHGVRHTNEKYHHDEFDSARVTACVSRDEETTAGDYSGRVTDFLRNSSIDTDAVYYLCGNRNMINEIFDILTEAGVSGDRIYTEVFF